MPPDWYPDLDDAVERYWDGSAWDGVRPLGDAATGEVISAQRRTARAVYVLVTVVVVAAVWVAVALLLHNLTS